MTDDTIHTCSYYCERPGCIRAQRDELRDRLESALAAPPSAPVGANVRKAGEVSPYSDVVLVADLAQQPAAPSNARGEWVLVPREPTEAMISHGEEWEYSTISNGPAMARQLYAAMLAAAPSPAAAPQQTAAVDEAMVERACKAFLAEIWPDTYEEADDLRAMIRRILSAALARVQGGRDHG